MGGNNRARGNVSGLYKSRSVVQVSSKKRGIIYRVSSTVQPGEENFKMMIGIETEMGWKRSELKIEVGRQDTGSAMAEGYENKFQHRPVVIEENRHFPRGMFRW